MAAVLCQSVGSLCKTCVECVVWPCKKGCECCGASCSACCTLMNDVVCSPFFPYLVTTLALNVAPVVFGVRAVTECDGDKMWLLTNAVLAALHIVAAIYIVVKIQEEDEEEQEQEVITATVDGNREAGSESKKSMSSRLQNIFPISSTSQQNEERTIAGSLTRMGHVMCHDVGVAIYILVAAFWFVWQMYGIAKVFQLEDEAEEDVTEGSTCEAKEWIISSLICGYLYMMLACCAFGCSLCCLKRA